MSHLHSVIDEDVAFVIDPATRIVSPRSTDCLKLVQGDHNSEVYTFHLPRYIEGHDMSSCNRVEVHFINLGNGQQNPGVFRVSDFGLNEDETEVYARWVISGEATKYAGSLCFIVSFKCIPDDVVEYAWNTEKYKGVTVGEGIDNGEAIMEKYSDVLAEWEQRVFENTLPTDGTPGQVLTKTETGTEWKDAPGGADWNASEGEPGHVLNRTHYKELVELVNGTAAYNADMDEVILETDAVFVVDETYTVIYNGVEYTCTAFGLDDGEGNIAAVIGNGAAVGMDDTGEPFFMVGLGGFMAINDLNGATEATVRIIGEKVFPIPREYLPPMSYVVDVADGEDKSGSSGDITIDFDHNGLYDTTELYEALKNGWPIYLDITAMNNGIESRLLVTSWRTVAYTLDELVAMGRLSNLPVLLYAHEYTEATDRWWHAYIN